MAREAAAILAATAPPAVADVAWDTPLQDELRAAVVWRDVGVR